MGISYVRLAVGVVSFGLFGVANPGCTVHGSIVPVFDSGFNPRDVGPVDSANDAYVPHDVGTDIGHDAPVDAFFSGDAACESATNSATLTRQPADIIWVIDNSNSMATAIEAVRTGLNDFAATLVASDLDYRIIMLSARTGAYSICVPEPLAGPSCADAERFFQTDVNIHSTQPIEQIIGTLAQTPGYTPTDALGGAPWQSLLRPGATRTFVVVTDDNQRTCAAMPTQCAMGIGWGYAPLTDLSLEDYPGGLNPFNGSMANTRALGPGILDATAYPGLFDGYTFDAVYGWGSDTDPSVRCMYPGGTSPPSSGSVYTTLVERTHGVRAHICDGAAAFGPFFSAIRDSVVRGSPIECTVTIPPAPTGMTFQAGRVNVIMRLGTEQTYFGHVPDVGHCDATRGGWYYDDNTTPTQILLCPSSCDTAQSMIVGTDSGLDVQFGCQSVLI